MKPNNIFLWGSFLMLGIFSLAGCSDDDEYDVDGSSDNIVYLNPRTDSVFSATVMRTSFGTLGYVGADIPLNIQHAVDGSVRVSVSPDTTLVSAYNEKNSTQCAQFPKEALSQIQVEEANFSNGSRNDTLTISTPAELNTKFTAEEYLLPLKVTVTGAKGVRGSYNHGTAYLKVTTMDVTDFVLLTQTEYADNIIKTPVGTFGGIDNEIKVLLRGAVSSDWTSTLEVDNSLVETYNESNGTNYQALSQDILSQLIITPEVIPMGETTAETGIKVSAPIDALKSLTGEYVIPMRVVSTYDGKTIQEESDIVYITLGIKSSLINDDATEFLGTKATDHDGWTVLDCENLDPESYEGLFDTGWRGGWDFIEKGSSAKFTLDLGTEKSLCGFYLSSYVMNDCKVEISTDNSNWTEVGHTSEHTAKEEYDETTWEYKQEYVFYSAVKCRYIRYTFSLDDSSWAWNYSGYSAIGSFALYFN